MGEYPENQLIPSIASESLSDVLTVVADASLSVVDSGALASVPVVGIFTGMLKAGRDVSAAWRLKKLVAFLSRVDVLSLEQRVAFCDQFEDPGAREDYGGALLVLIERAEDIEKPKVLARLLVAHVEGAFGREDLLRMSRMVDRCFFEDLENLETFRPGLQMGRELAYQNLAAIGFVHPVGFDGGTWDAEGNEVGGTLYELSKHGKWLAEFGLHDRSPTR